MADRLSPTPALWDPALADRAMVLLEFAGCGGDAESIELTRKTTHDIVLAVLRLEGRRQAGPVEWRFFEPSVARGLLVDSGLDPDDEASAGLLHFLEEPGVQLCVASVAWLP